MKTPMWCVQVSVVFVALSTIGTTSSFQDTPPSSQEEQKRDIVDKALKYLAGAQDSTGLWAADNGGVIVASSLAGLAFLALGEDVKKGPYAEHVKKAASSISNMITKEYSGGVSPYGTRTGWNLSFAALFLSELYHRNPSPGLEKTLNVISNAIERSQLDNGGWTHGGLSAMGGDKKSYGSFAAMTGWHIAALGVLKKAGIKTSDDCVRKGVEYLKRCTLDNGFLAYNSGHPHCGMMLPRMGEIQRTNLAFYALACAKHDDALQKKIRSSIDKQGMDHLVRSTYGEPLNCLSAALACASMGKEKRDAFYTAHTNKILKKYDQGKGYFPYGDGVAGGNNWATACYALILQIEEGRLKLLVP